MTDGQTLTLRLTRLEKGQPRARRRVRMEFHISREARNLYQFDESLFSLSGNVVFANFLATRIFAKKMNDKKNVSLNPEKAVLPAQLNAMGLIDEILHFVAELYREEKGTDLFSKAMDFVSSKIGVNETNDVLVRFAMLFPNVDVYKGKMFAEDFLKGSTDGIKHTEVIFEEVLLLWLANVNPAFAPYMELFDDRELRASSSYSAFVEALKEFFELAPVFGPDSQHLIEMLRAPAIAFPTSLYGQLQYIREKWGLILGKFLSRLLSSLDFMKEEERLFWKGGPVKSEGYDSSLHYGGLDFEPERFSMDKEWMPKVILMAKSALVWLDQLSKKYQRTIATLDQIPDEELDQLGRRGFNALWLIGLWERSKASKRIKQMCGNPEAEASAYSLFDYDIANELGGWGALHNLRERAWRRGIRIASDMVPNHTAMDSRWISQNPEWFLQLDYCPFPGYTFNGVNLSQDPNIELKLEDHYYDRSDAAVVFLHKDHRTGKQRFIYHGNDGTSMPWNDTAQINYLNPEAREAVIQVILHVARNFPIIRFDAAMTLAKKHIQRLWFPTPGSGGDIASRAEHGLSKEDFDKAIPEEFWREVVDRVAREVPDTLLLAEAFWMMEGYFVRTLGMHRVYNSAFMHMFKKEENEKYRYTIKNTLEFDPDILKRFVNFMNNPDEETAAVQFGTGDKYFGVATMMVTMPGTPMFGHGQVEGFREKYGMEYRRAYWDEKDDYGLIDRHEREIFPILHKRYLFAEVKHFYLYDLWTSSGSVNQNVFAYSNGDGNEFALVFYNNAYDRALGWIKASAGYAVKKHDGSKEMRQTDLAEALQLSNEPNSFLIFREQGSGLWYVRKCQDLFRSGLYVELNGYQKQVFLDLKEVYNSDSFPIERLCYELNGSGVGDIHEAMKDMTHRTLYHGFYDAFHPLHLKNLYETAWTKKDLTESFWSEQEAKLASFYWRIKEYTASTVDPNPLIQESLAELKAVLNWPRGFKKGKWEERFKEPSLVYYAYLIKSVLSPIGKFVDSENAATVAKALVQEWYLDRKLYRILMELGIYWTEARHYVSMVYFLLDIEGWIDRKVAPKFSLLESILNSDEAREVIHAHWFENVLYFDKEGFEYLMWWVYGSAFLTSGTKSFVEAEQKAYLEKAKETILGWESAAQKSGYRLEALLTLLAPAESAAKKKKTTAVQEVKLAVSEQSETKPTVAKKKSPKKE